MFYLVLHQRFQSKFQRQICLRTTPGYSGADYAKANELPSFYRKLQKTVEPTLFVNFQSNFHG